MTEAEAKMKWCFAAVASHTNPRQGFETAEQLGDEVNYPKTFACIGSACMAWRWYETHVPNNTLAEPIANVAADELVRSTRSYGCCGLAGPWFGQMKGFERARGSDVR